ncbi:MAG: PHP domain-containing protein [Desulfobacterales bacterium]|nr:PHP domain-containing protein [Desulfobacterales bacterium]MBF0396964.1 PHP domain-containing protein [Desulfobacterales bacterium]
MNSQDRIDLHIHSTASDGTLSPREIISLAKESNITAIAITDHDTIDGSKEAISNGIPQSLNFLTGIELSASPPPSFPCSGSFHILGYGIDVNNKSLNEILPVLRDARKNRNPLIIEKLNKLGIKVSLDEVSEHAKDSQIGRPHIAMTMVNKGLIKSIDEAFNKFLGKGKPAYVDKYRIDCPKAIEMINNAGGIAVLAHPFLIKPKNNESIENLIITLKDIGISGIEAYYPEHTTEYISYYVSLAKKYNLIITGGTDFHGDLKPNIKLGFGKGDFFVPFEFYENIVKMNENGRLGTT